MITKADIARLRRLCALASPPPWEADIDDPDTGAECWTGKWYTADGTWSSYPAEEGLTPLQDAANARLVAEARTWLPRLLDEIERQQHNVEAARGALRRARGCR